MTTHIAYIGLGSNLSNPSMQVLTAYQSMQGIAHTLCIALSPLYQSKAIGPEQPDYINAVAKIETSLTAESLLDALQSIENQQKRVRVQHWGPRTIDLDILAFGQQSIQTERLTIPHAHMRDRNFVLAPLMDLAPSLQLPCGEAITTLLHQCGLDNLKKLSKPN